MILYGFWRSLATCRVRIALSLKGISATEIPVDLLKGEQFEEAYRRVNPARALPALVVEEGRPPLFQSLAILEWLEETRPEPPLLPRDPLDRARARGLALIAAADTHPLHVPRVRKQLAQRYGADEESVHEWGRHFIGEGAASLEGHLARDAQTGRFCHGDAPGLADICLYSLKAGADMFGLDLAPWPTLKRVAGACEALEAFSAAHPLRQPGAPKKDA
jgi:maleylacetoacetate isomerase